MASGIDLQDNIKVAVRVRPLNKRETELDSPVVVFMNKNQTLLKSSPNSPDSSSKTFAFDYCFESTDKNSKSYASQEDVFCNLGEYILTNALNGYNACMFAYGQTGSGKTYTMMGNQASPGVIPRLCEALFERVNELGQLENSRKTQFKVEVSYMEIYNEKVYDLFDITGNRKALGIREHKILGPYVEGLSKLLVCSVKDVKNLMEVGNKSRTVGATNMNLESSRSHAVFTIILSSTVENEENKTKHEKVSRISLVDLAGSERARKTGSEGRRLREGCNINKSLTTLMRVIASLSTVSSSKVSTTGKLFIPYRDSTLTWLLKDSLGGNSKTVMIATLSPVLDNYDETLSTLRYANHAKNIVNHAVVNEDPNTKLIKELRDEVSRLREELFSAKSTSPLIKDQLNQSETLIKEYSKTWEEKMDEAKYQLETRQMALGNLGISIQPEGIRVKSDRVYLVNLNPDPLLNEMLIYYLKEQNTIGSGSLAAIKLGGIGIQSLHCTINVENLGNKNCKVYIIPNDECRTLINGRSIVKKEILHNRDRLVLGMYQFFRINCPDDSDMPTSSNMDNSYDRSDFSDFEYARQELLQNDIEKNFQLQRIIKDINHACIDEDEISMANNNPSRINKQIREYSNSLKHPDNNQHTRIYNNNNSFNNNISLANNQMLPDTQTDVYGSLNKRGNLSTSFIGCQLARSQTMVESQSNSLNGYSIFESPLHKQQSEIFYNYLNEKEKAKRACLGRLSHQLAKAHSLVSEANFMAQALKIEVKYSVTLQIPVASLCLNKTSTNFIMIEPAIQVLRLDDAREQIWSIDKLMDKLVDMREIYGYEKVSFHPGHSSTDSGLDSIGQPDCNYLSNSTIRNGAFYSYEDDLSLIGVANIHLSCFFNCQRFKYLTPIINQQGEVNGKMKVELSLSGGNLINYNRLLPNNNNNLESVGELNNMTNSMTSNGTDSGISGMSNSQTKLTFKVTIHSCIKVPAKMTKSLQCSYRFWDEENPTIINIPKNSTIDYTQDGGIVQFNHTTEFIHPLNEELLEHLSNHAISFELYGASFSQVESQVLLQDYFRHSVMNPQMSFSKKPPKDSSTPSNSDRRNRKIRGLSLNESSTNEEEAIKEAYGIISNINAVKTFAERWREVYRKIELWVSIEELNEEGSYEKVFVQTDDKIKCGGVYQLKHGVSRRIRVLIRPNKINRASSGFLPVSCHNIKSIEVGCVESVGHRLNLPDSHHSSTSLRRTATISSTKPNDFLKSQQTNHSRDNNGDLSGRNNNSYDSYQEIDLMKMRETWTEAMTEKQEYLKKNLQELAKFTNKTQNQLEREDFLLQRWLRTTDERDLVLIPPEGSGIPGAPASWTPLPTMEFHLPIIFMNLQPNDYCEEALKDPIRSIPLTFDEMSQSQIPSSRTYGENGVLSNEEVACQIRSPHIIHGITKEQDSVIFPTPFKQLSIVKNYEKLVGAVAAWDFGIHDCIVLNRITPSNEKIYLIVKVTMQLTRPVMAEVVLRKRICINISRKEGLTDYFRKTFTKFITSQEQKELWTCVIYQLVAGVPQTTHEMEPRDSLALMAAASENKSNLDEDSDKENLIEKYLKAVSAVESIFYLDKLRQESAWNDQKLLDNRQKSNGNQSNLYSGDPSIDFMDSFEGNLDSSKRFTSEPNLDEESERVNIDFLENGSFRVDKPFNDGTIVNKRSNHQPPTMPSVIEETECQPKLNDVADSREENMAWNRKIRSRMQRKTLSNFYVPPN